MPALETAVFTAAGATVGRRLDEHVGDVVNVKSFGAIGDGTTNDRAAIQAAIDYCFGTAALPHGTSTELNKALFFPSGYYKLDNPLVFTQVKRGHIFGCVSTALTCTTAGKTLVYINGMEDTLIENISTHFVGTSVGWDLDWDGSGSVGLGHNMFRKVSCGAQYRGDGSIGFRIANSGNDGDGNAFWNCISEFIQTGFHIVGADAFNQSFQAICGAGETAVGWKIDGGSAVVTGISNGGGDAVTPSAGQLDFQVNGACTLTVQGGRSEANRFLELNVSGAKALVSGINCGNNSLSNNITMVAGSSLIADEVFTYRAVGAGTIYRRGGSFDITGFSGTMAQNI